MPLPDLIAIVPLDKPVRAEITVPGSKSITNRALVLAALAEGETTLHGALWSEDTQVMVECLQELGFMVNVAPDPNDICNRSIAVYGKGGTVPRGGTAAQPLELFVGNAGTAARFLAALACLGQGVYRLHGVPRMHERPQAALFQALRELGYRIDSPNDKLPAAIHGAGPKPGKCRVSIAESSQFASALLLCSQVGKWQVEIAGENADESPYVAMTAKMLEVFPKAGGVFQVEPDASSGSYFWGAGIVGAEPVYGAYSEQFILPVATSRLLPVKVAHWPDSGWQVDQHFPRVLLQTQVLALGRACCPQRAVGHPESPQNPRPVEPSRRAEDSTPYLGAASATHVVEISRARDLGDSILTAIILAPFSGQPIRFTDLGRLRVQECERVVALRTELTKCGARVIEEADTLTIYPSALHGAAIDTYNDHRMAMSFAILGLKVPGIKLKNPSCVKKTFPNFFQKLAAPPPGGLGAKILDGNSGRALTGAELFAE